MKVLVLGSTGHIGSLVVTRLLHDGHEVVAFVHRNNPFENTPGVTAIAGDVHNSDDLRRAVGGVDAVISTLGSWHTKEKDVLSATMHGLVPLMEQAGPKRIVTLTGSDAHLSADVPSLAQKLMRPLIKLGAPKILSDSEEHMRILQASTLDWTVVRSPVMRSIGPKGAKLSLIPPLPWSTTHRDDVAQSIVGLATGRDYLYKAPHIY